MRKQDKISKLTTIKKILSGDYSLTEFRDPKIFFITSRGGETFEYCPFNSRQGIGKMVMNKDEFEKWKAINICDRDTILLFEENIDCEPLIETESGIVCSADMAEILNASIQSSHKHETKPVIASNDVANKISSLPKGSLKETNDAGQTIIEEAKAIINGGLMSEYGDKWKLSDESVTALRTMNKQ